MAQNTSQIAALLLPGVREIKGRYKEISGGSQWAQIFAQGKSDMQQERTVHVRYLGLPALKQQGGQTNFDNGAGQRFTYVHLHLAVGLGYAFTREAIDDNLYKSQFDPTNLGLIRSFRAFKEIVAADVLNQGNVYNPAVGGDGVALFATNHPVDGFSVANMPTVQVGLNEASLLMANNMIRRFRDNAGILISAQAKKLVVPIELRHVAKRLLETPLRPGTSNNDVNTVKDNEDIREGYIAMDYLTSPYAWFVLSDQGGLIYLERKPFETSMQVEFTTDNLLVKAYERYYLGYDDWRAGWGSYATN
jgi:hypothetical protein